MEQSWLHVIAGHILKLENRRTGHLLILISSSAKTSCHNASFSRPSQSGDSFPFKGFLSILKHKAFVLAGNFSAPVSDVREPSLLKHLYPRESPSPSVLSRIVKPEVER
ncbi:uncharacterized protein L3040_007483 [Drepanopeziza brunnea f. sp. 'multigermtubi']|uniref:uncharacterized protein n=1 Tax=Drepanopeziza brunnea f. sp. 'multigermtubi' TaxID=698441 RepID=UPI002393E3F4|nr:hypothetical protein L3040_007483 [Drepanopeziza brunnea f. sp. 'multigermtubi']